MKKPLAIVALAALMLLPTAAAGQTPAEIRAEIEERNAEVEALNKEIAEYERQLEEVGTKKQTLQNTLDELNLQRKKLNASINATKSKVRTLQLELQTLSEDITGKEGAIKREKAGIAETLRRLDERERQALMLVLLSHDDLSSIWNDMDAIYTLQGALRADIAVLSSQKESLTETKTVTEEKRAELVREQNNLVAEQGSLDATRRAQNELLDATKSEESAFQEILAEKQAAKVSIESALIDLHDQFQYAVDPSAIPPAGKGVLRWPVDKVKITQYFGNTEFARSGAYGGKGHNGVDFRAAVGTPIRASLRGSVLAVGNTDAIRGCYSFGKWVMLKHANGLSTLYSHLSQINVEQGESVGTGDIIGFSGNTGYSTGPHLHFGVYVSSAVRIMKLGEATKRKTPCANAVMPVAPLSAYLNPMDYF